MERFLYMSPAIVAILIFIYMKYVQKKRLAKRRKRFQKTNQELMQILKNKSEIKNENDTNKT